MAPRSECQQIARLGYLVVALFAAVLLLQFGNLGSPITSPRSLARPDFDTEVTMGSDIVALGEASHRNDECDRNHKLTECSPCPSCSGAVSITAEGNFRSTMIVASGFTQSHFEDVVPMGIRRPPRSA